MINNNTPPARPLEERAALMTDSELRRLILIDRRRFRKTLSEGLRARTADRHAILLAEYRRRNLARAATTL